MYEWIEPGWLDGLYAVWLFVKVEERCDKNL